MSTSTSSSSAISQATSSPASTSSNIFSSSSSSSTPTTTSLSSTTSSQSGFNSFSSSTFFPFSPASTATTVSTSSSLSQAVSPSPSSFPNPAFSTSLSLPPLSHSPVPSRNPASEAQVSSDTGTTWTPGNIALIAVCSFIIFLAVVACIVVVVVRRRIAKREMDRQFEFHVPPADDPSNRRRGSIGSVEKYGHGYSNSDGGAAKGYHKGAPAYIPGLGSGGRHKKSLSTEAQAEAETSGTAPLLMRKVRPASSRHSHAAVYGDEESRRSLHVDRDRGSRSASRSANTDDDDGDSTVQQHVEDSDADTPREPSPPSSPSIPLLASASSPALNASYSRQPVPGPPSSWRPSNIAALIPPVPLSPPSPSPDQRQLMHDLESVQNLYTAQHPPSRRSSRATRRSSRRVFADVNASGYDSDDSESLYSQASAPASVSAPSLISSKSVRSMYGRQSRSGQALLPASNAGLGVGVLPPIPQSPFAHSASSSEHGSETQRESVATFRASLSTSASQPAALNRSTEAEDEDENDPLANPERATHVAKLLQSRQRNTASHPAAPGPPTRTSSLVSHIERTGSIRPALALDSVEEQSEPSSTLGRRG